jgi:hypothetical protein
MQKISVYILTCNEEAGTVAAVKGRIVFLDGLAGFVIALGNPEGTFYRYTKLMERQSGRDNHPDEN